MFQTLPEPKLDPILALMTTFREDPRPEKIDLGVGVYRDASGQTPVMAAIREAEQRLAAEQQTKAYVGLAGDRGFNDAMRRLVFADSVAAERLSIVQTPGGSGALRLLFDLVRRSAPDATVWTSAPTWPNHHAILREVGLQQSAYRYFDPETRAVDFPAMIEDLGRARPGDVVLLHGCCHNPTGADLRLDEWQAVADLVADRGLVPLVDLAYQGFGDGLEADAAGLRCLAGRVPEMLAAASCSKNFGVYRDRVGAAFVLTADRDKARTEGAMMALARTNYSMPPDHGAAAVGLVLAEPDLRSRWMEELEAMRLRMLDLRRGLAAALAGRSHSDRFSFLAGHRGMFTLTGATPKQVETLRKEHAIYVVGDGRMNVAGLPEDRLGRVAEAFLAAGL